MHLQRLLWQHVAHAQQQCDGGHIAVQPDQVRRVGQPIDEDADAPEEHSVLLCLWHPTSPLPCRHLCKLLVQLPVLMSHVPGTAASMVPLLRSAEYGHDKRL